MVQASLEAVVRDPRGGLPPDDQGAHCVFAVREGPIVFYVSEGNIRRRLWEHLGVHGQWPSFAQPAPASTTVVAGSTLPINSAIFAPNEAVVFWYNAPNDQALPLYILKGQITTERQHKDRMADGATHDINNGHELNADAQGVVTAMRSVKGLEPGAYTLVAYGLSSDATAVIAFQVQ